mmetsp:Transcript_19454/g.42136  ORF Transcript_19454/g.42136 Transcript_19454/m.42136 type:complete len:255 (+) Transcript_19454:1060-1824(+)
MAAVGCIVAPFRGDYAALIREYRTLLVHGEGQPASLTLMSRRNMDTVKALFRAHCDGEEVDRVGSSAGLPNWTYPDTILDGVLTTPAAGYKRIHVTDLDLVSTCCYNGDEGEVLLNGHELASLSVAYARKPVPEPTEKGFTLFIVTTHMRRTAGFQALAGYMCGTCTALDMILDGTTMKIPGWQRPVRLKAVMFSSASHHWCEVFNESAGMRRGWWKCDDIHVGVGGKKGELLFMGSSHTSRSPYVSMLVYVYG